MSCSDSASTGGDPDDPASPVIERREPIIIANVSARFEHFRHEAHGGGRVKGWMGVPLLSGDRLIGMLTLDKLEEDFYTREHGRLAQAFAAFATSAIENARRFETERAAREQAETLRAAAQSLDSALSLPQVFDLILSELRKAVPYDSCSVQQIEGTKLVIVGGHGFPNLDELLGQRFDWRGPDDLRAKSCSGASPSSSQTFPLALSISRMKPMAADASRAGWACRCSSATA